LVPAEFLCTLKRAREGIDGLDDAWCLGGGPPPEPAEPFKVLAAFILALPGHDPFATGYAAAAIFAAFNTQMPAAGHRHQDAVGQSDVSEVRRLRRVRARQLPFLPGSIHIQEQCLKQCR
jgi:hypothetical protein